ncbi:low temperature requirement protein A [Microbacterium sp. ABRD28]|uniref:low temperature requirement protein A n=1 Tax=Microbacterium sp. ABRD28 TaxID=2268461 RepID=UPI000F554216|nr:low temperature requirement protein A [Microbacterium sp. ABRD28]
MSPADPPAPAGRRPGRVRLPRPMTTGEDSRVTTFELFFDLVYVFAFTQVSRLMAETHNAAGIAQALIILALLWWTWVGYAWLANRLPADQPFLRTGMTVAMIGVFLCALTIPEAFDDFDGGLYGPIVFAVAYAVVRLVHLILFFVTATDDPPLLRQLMVWSVSSVLPACAALIIGAAIGGEVQAWVWALAIVFEGLGTRALSPGGGGWRIHSVAHWSERHGLIVILALGESIVAIGVGVAREPISVPIILGTATSIVISVLLWWSYFRRLATVGEHALARLSGGPLVKLARDAYSYVHFLIVAGIVLAALGIEDAMAHITDTEPLGWFGAAALGSGIALFAAGTVWFAVLVGERRPYFRGLEAVVATASIPLLAVLPPAAALTAAVVLMGVVAGAEGWIHLRADRREAQSSTAA